MSQPGLGAAPIAPAAASPLVPDAFLLHIGDPAHFAAVRALFTRADFHEGSVARRLGGHTLAGFPRLCDGRRTLAGEVEDAQAALVRLLLDAEPLAASQARQLCGDAGIDALLALGVLVPAADDPTALATTVLLAPSHGVWVASDLAGTKGRASTMPKDVVFPALSVLTSDFLRTLPPPSRDTRVLELCGGTGIAALLAARHGAAEAWTTDIGERSTHFARFNAALNGLENVRCVTSDVWGALDGETFDHVYAHPPYVPALAHTYDYRDAGGDGEQVTRRIVEGLPVHLRAGGTCAITCAITDRAEARLEARIRGWLGDAADEFDLVVVERHQWDAMHVYRTATRGVVPPTEFTDCERWLAHFHGLGIRQFVHCTFELRRVAAGRPPLTARRAGGPVVDAASIDWVLGATARERSAPTPEARMRGIRPRLVPGVRLDVRMRADADGAFVNTGAVVQLEYPVQGNVIAPAVAPALLELCDGTRDAADLLAAVREAELVDDTVSVDDVARMLDVLVAAGALEVPGLPVPRPPALVAEPLRP